MDYFNKIFNENGKLKEEIVGLKKKIEKLEEENRKLKEEKDAESERKKNNTIRRRGLAAELLSELFDSLPPEKALFLLAKMPNGLLARIVGNKLNGIQMANKLNVNDCGSLIEISENGFAAKITGYNLWKSNIVRALIPVPIPAFKLGSKKSSIAFYFEVQILRKIKYRSIAIGFCCREFPLEGEWLGSGRTNSIGLNRKYGMSIGQSFGFGESFIKFGNPEGIFWDGDMIGIGIIHCPANSSIESFGTWNGEFLGKLKMPEKFIKLQLFPAVHMSLGGESIGANFGKEDWLFKDFEIALA